MKRRTFLRLLALVPGLGRLRPAEEPRMEVGIDWTAPGGDQSIDRGQCGRCMEWVTRDTLTPVREMRSKGISIGPGGLLPGPGAQTYTMMCAKCRLIVALPDGPVGGKPLVFPVRSLKAKVRVSSQYFDTLPPREPYPRIYLDEDDQ